MIKVGTALMEYAEQLERERGIPKDVLIDSLKEAMVAAYRKYAKYKTTADLECDINERTGEIGIYELRHVVSEYTDDPENPRLELLLKDARKLKPDVEEGDILEIEVTPDDFGRIAAQTAKQVITQRIREAEKKLITKEFEERKGTVVTAIVQRIEGRNVVVNIGRSEAVLPPREQLPSEYYRVGNKLRAFVLDLRDSGRVPQIIVSQAHPAMVQEVFELEVPEIEDGLVEIKSVAREAGYRTKVAVTSHDPDVDAQGACIGTRGSRIQAIVNELKNEKIDIIKWSDSPTDFIINALAPAKIIQVEILNDEPGSRRAVVIVPDDQLSLAIGREGQNVRLAAKLTGYKLDIKSIAQLNEELEQYDEEEAGEETEAAQLAEAVAAEGEPAAPEAGEAVTAETEPAAAETAEEEPEEKTPAPPAEPEATESQDELEPVEETEGQSVAAQVPEETTADAPDELVEEREPSA